MRMLLIASAVLIATQAHGAPSKVPAPKVLGPNSCKTQGAFCSTHTLTMPGHSVTGHFTAEHGLGFKVLNSYPNDVVSTDWVREGSDLNYQISVQIPAKFDAAKITIPIPTKLISDTNMQLSTRDSLVDAIVATINEAESKTVHAYAEKGPGIFPKSVIVVFTKISDEDRVFAAGIKALQPRPAAMTDKFGQKNFRGAAQEVKIQNIVVPYRYFSPELLNDFKSDAELKAKLHIKPNRDGLNAQIHFQDGNMKVDPSHRGHNSTDPVRAPLDKSRDYCTLYVNLSAPYAITDGFVIEGLVTLVTGSSHYGPIGGGKPAENFSQGSILGFQNTGAQSYSVPGKGYNKFGNGRADSGNVYMIGCDSKNIEPITVGKVVKQFGEFSDRVSFSYPRMNTLEAYLDYKMGLK